jgi:hypothetical protein
MSYVSAEPVTQPTAPPLTIASVQANWLQNAGAGAGVAAIVIALRLLWHAMMRSLHITSASIPEDWPVTLLLAGALAMLAFGMLMFIRSSIDELIDAQDWHEMRTLIEQLEAETQSLAEANEGLRYQLADAKAQLLQDRRMRSAGAYVAPTATPPAFAAIQPDANELAERLYRGMAWGRTDMQAAGWTQSKWATAKAVLVDACVIAYAGKTPQRIAATYSEAVDRLTIYAQRIEAAGHLTTTNNDTTPEVATTPNNQRGGGEI